MNALYPMGTPITPVRPLPNFAPRLRPHPIPGQDSILVTVDGTPLRVFHTAGRPTSVHIQMPDDILLPGVMAADAVSGSLHGDAAAVANGLLAGIRQAGEWPAITPEGAAEPMSTGRFMLLCLGFGLIGSVVVWVLVTWSYWMERQR